jgi:hypothetical protein
MKKLNFIFLFLLFISACGNLFSQTLTAIVRSPKVGLGDQFEVSFTFNGPDVNNVKGFTSPDFANFMILSGPNQSTNMQIINGAVSGSITYSYYLQPRAIGSFTITSASVTYKGTIYKSQPIKIEVVKGSAPPPTAKNQQGTTPEAQNSEIAKNLFIRVFADKQKVYQGEQVTVTYKLYTRLNIASQMQLSKLPQYQGFWAEELETSNNINFTVENFEGRQYRVGILKKAALFPSQSGELTVSPMELKVPVQIQHKRKPGNSIFDDFFNDPFFGNAETVQYMAKSNTVKVNVMPLPENKPESFKGAVGQFTLTSELNKNSTKTNEPLSLKLNITGTGNVTLLTVPEINLPSGMEKYDPKSTDQVTRQNKISGKKSIEYLIVPRNAGKKEIPPVKFSYFDPNKKTYVTLSTPPYNINVEQGAGDQGYAGMSKEDIKLLGDDIRYIKTSPPALQQKGEILLYQLGFWTAAVLPFFALIGAVMWKRREDRLSGNISLMRYQKAQRISAKRLKTAKTLMLANKQTEFYTEISLALFGYLEDKLHIPKSEFTLDRASYELKRSKVDETLITGIVSCAEKCEYIRFAPVEDGTTEMKNMYQQVEKLIIGVERSKKFLHPNNDDEHA